MKLRFASWASARWVLAFVVALVAIAPRLSALIPPPSRGNVSCFSCYPGGYGSPEICSVGEHFDRDPIVVIIPVLFGGVPHVDCAPDDNCASAHDYPCVDLVQLSSLERAVQRSDTDAIRRYVGSSTRLALNRGRSSIRVLDCRGGLVKEIAVPRQLMTELDD